MKSKWIILICIAPIFTFSLCKQSENIGQDKIEFPISALEEIDYREALQKSSENFTLSYTSNCFNEEGVQKYLNELQQLKEYIETELNIKKQDFKYQLRIYESIEEKGLKMGSTLPSELLDEDQSLHIVKGKYMDGSIIHADTYRQVLRTYIGIPSHSWLEEGLSYYLKNRREKITWDQWSHKIFSAKANISAENLINEEALSKESIWLKQIQSYLMVQKIIAQDGLDEFIRNYKNKTYSKTELDAIIANSLNSLNVDQEEENQFSFPYLNGFNFAHEGYRMYNGYGSNLAKQSLDRLNFIGTNAIAIVPYSYMRDDKKATPIPIVTRSGTETDEGLIVSQRHAQELGMYSLLKPQIWLGKSWPGSIEMSSDEAWDDFFKYYKKWIIHFATLAELFEFDAFCVGVEFAKASIAKPAKWRSLIKDVRAIYSGPITYAANWGEEFENLSFWDDLDLIGLNCYYPLSSKELTTKSQMEKEMAKTAKIVAQISKKYQKKVWLTEAGFRSIEACWRQPHAQPGNQDFNEVDQALCYEVLTESIAKSKDVVTGVFFWKWPSMLNEMKKENKGFSPYDKKAEYVVNKFFSENQ